MKVADSTFTINFKDNQPHLIIITASSLFNTTHFFAF